MKESLVKDYLLSCGIAFEENKNLRDVTWIKRGGVARFFVQPHSSDDLEKICRFFFENHLPFDMMGGSSNIYCKSTYNPFILLSTLKCNRFVFHNDCIECECGVNTSLLSKKCCERNFGGFEGLTKLPGTVGGAICNNASAFNCSLSKMLKSAIFLDSSGNLQTLSAEEFGFQHRSSALKRGEIHGVLLKCFFSIVLSEENLLEKSKEYERVRRETQQGSMQNLGSCFTSNRLRKLNLREFNSFYSYLRYISFLILFHFFHNRINNSKKVYKEYMLKILGYSDVSKYVSDKNINCFIWSDDEADFLFLRYSEFMKKYNTSSTFEIEIRE